MIECGLDWTVFEWYEHQEGAVKGYNPRRHGRPSHHPLLAVLAEIQFISHGSLGSNDTGPRGRCECMVQDDERPTILAQRSFFCNYSAEPTNHAKGTKRKPRSGN